MLTSETLRQAIIEILGIPEKYIVPLDEGWYVPTYDPEDKVGTWIGYRILTKRQISRAIRQDKVFAKSLRVKFRLAFIGPQAEELADSTLLWDDRKDVTKAFEKCNFQLNYNKRLQFSYPVANGGLNDNLCWCVDFEAQGFYTEEANWPKWELKEVSLGGNIITGGL